MTELVPRWYTGPIMNNRERKNMMKVDLYHAAFEDEPVYVATWKFDPKKYGHKRAAEAVYSASQNLTENGWGRDGGLNKDFVYFNSGVLRVCPFAMLTRFNFRIHK